MEWSVFGSWKGEFDEKFELVGVVCHARGDAIASRAGLFFLPVCVFVLSGSDFFHVSQS